MGVQAIGFTFEADTIPQDLEELGKERRVDVVVQDLLLRMLRLLHEQHAHLQFRLDENLSKKEDRRRL